MTWGYPHFTVGNLLKMELNRAWKSHASGANSAGRVLSLTLVSVVLVDVFFHIRFGSILPNGSSFGSVSVKVFISC